MPLPDSVYHLYGHVSPAEMQLLYDLASQISVGGTIVEIGSFQGKSTVCLGLGAKQVPGVKVYAIDSFEDVWVDQRTHYGMDNHAALLMNLCLQSVADIVRVVALPSRRVSRAWGQRTVKPPREDGSGYNVEWHESLPLIDLLFIDGSHEYADVLADLGHWHYPVSPNGRILMHDTSGHYPDVTRALQEFLSDQSWKIAQQVDSIAVLERV